MNIKIIEQAIEAILFASGEPIALAQLGEVLEVDTQTLTSLIQKLNDKYIERETVKDGTTSVKTRNNSYVFVGKGLAPFRCKTQKCYVILNRCPLGKG